MSDRNQETGRTNGAGLLVDVFEAHNVEHVFGLCGHTLVAVLDALSRSSIRFVPVHHEQMATHAADAYARVTGRASVALVHLGPGLTNAITGIANASLDSIPMVVISGNVQSYFFGRHAHMESLLHHDADQARSVEPWCKRVWRVERPEALLPALEAAFLTAESGRPGPVLVDVAMDVFSSRVELPADYRPLPVPSRAAPDPALVARTVDDLIAAERPVLYVGGGVIRSGGSAVLAEAVDRIGAPVAYSIMGKGALSDKHRLNVGMTGNWGTPAANAACAGADLILAIGTDFQEVDTSSWTPGKPFSFPATRLIHVHDDPTELGRSYVPDLAVTSDARLFLEALNLELGRRDVVARGQLDQELVALRTAFAESQAAHAAEAAFPMRPERVLADLRTALPESALIVADTGWNKNGVGQQFPLTEPGTLLAPGGYATMGFGPSAALGAVLAAPDRQVVALVGDGAFLTNLSVIQTAVEESLPVVWVVMNNGTYATISGIQNRHFGNDYGSSFNSSTTDYAALAHALGAGGVRLERAEDLVQVLKEALASRRPFVIDIPTTRDAVPVNGAWDINQLFANGKE